MASNSGNMITPTTYPNSTEESSNMSITFNGVEIHTSPQMLFYGTFNMATRAYSGVYITVTKYATTRYGYDFRLYANKTCILNFDHDSLQYDIPSRWPQSGSNSGTYDINDVDGDNRFTIRLYCQSGVNGSPCEMHGWPAYESNGVHIYNYGGSHPRVASAPTVSAADNLKTSKSMRLAVSCSYSTVGSYEVYFRRHGSSKKAFVKAYMSKTSTGAAQTDHNKGMSGGVYRLDNTSSNPTYYGFMDSRLNQNSNYDFIVKTFWWGADSGNRFYTLFGRTADNNGGSVAAYWCDNKAYNTESPGLYPLLVTPTKKISLNVVTANTKVTATTASITVNMNIYSAGTLYVGIYTDLTDEIQATQVGTDGGYYQTQWTISNHKSSYAVTGTTSTPTSGNGISKTLSFTNLAIYVNHKVHLLLSDGYNHSKTSVQVKTTFPFVRIYDSTTKTFKRAMPYIWDGAAWTPYQAMIYDTAKAKYVGMNPDD